MRAPSPPIAPPVAATVTSLLAVALVPPAVPSAALAERWLRPVPGEVARVFVYSRASPFAAGAHRGVDLAAPPGTAVRAACGGTVAFAGEVAGQGRVVSVRCGARRVTHLPLASVAVRAGAVVAAGAPLGTVAPDHGGLHLGVRRASDPFGYEDPLALLPRTDRPLAPIAARPRRVGRPRRIRVPRAPVAPRAVRVPAPRPVPAPRSRVSPAGRGIAPVLDSRPRVSPVVDSRPRVSPADRSVAPWPVWAGLVLAVCGAAGSGTIRVRRRRRAAAATAAKGVVPRPVA